MANTTAKQEHPEVWLTVSCGDGHTFYASPSKEAAYDLLLRWARADQIVGEGPEAAEQEARIRADGFYEDSQGYQCWVEKATWAA